MAAYAPLPGNKFKRFHVCPGRHCIYAKCAPISRYSEMLFRMLLTRHSISLIMLREKSITHKNAFVYSKNLLSIKSFE